MTEEHPTRPEERHEDMNRQTDVISKLLTLVGKVLVPLAVTGVLVLVANHFQQKQMSQDIARMTVELKEMRKEASVMSHKIAIMWSGGGWESKYRSNNDEN